MVMLLAAGAATWFYFFYATFGRVPHEAFMGRATAVRLTFQPYRIQRYISSLAPLGTRFIKGVPQLSSMQGGPIRINWIHRLPYEISLLLEEQAEDSLAAAFFVNVRPEPNDFMEALNESRLLHVLRFVQWRPYQVTPKAEGVLMTQGWFPFHRIRSLWWRHNGRRRRTSPLPHYRANICWNCRRTMETGY